MKRRSKEAGSKFVVVGDGSGFTGKDGCGGRQGSVVRFVERRRFMSAIVEDWGTSSCRLVPSGSSKMRGTLPRDRGVKADKVDSSIVLFVVLFCLLWWWGGWMCFIVALVLFEK